MPINLSKGQKVDLIYVNVMLNEEDIQNINRKVYGIDNEI